MQNRVARRIPGGRGVYWYVLLVGQRATRPHAGIEKSVLNIRETGEHRIGVAGHRERSRGDRNTPAIDNSADRQRERNLRRNRKAAGRDGSAAVEYAGFGA